MSWRIESDDGVTVSGYRTWWEAVRSADWANAEEPKRRWRAVPPDGVAAVPVEHLPFVLDEGGGP